MATIQWGEAPWYKPLSKEDKKAQGLNYRSKSGWRQQVEVTGKNGKKTTVYTPIGFHAHIEYGDLESYQHAEDKQGATQKYLNDVGNFVIWTFDSKDPSAGAVIKQDGCGHISLLEINSKQQAMRVTFAKRGDVVVFFQVPKSVMGTLLNFAKSKQTGPSPVNGKVRHLLGIRFWDLVRIRGQAHGSRFKFEYWKHGSYKFLGGQGKRQIVYDDDGGAHTYLLSDRNYKRIQRDLGGQTSTGVTSLHASMSDSAGERLDKTDTTVRVTDSPLSRERSRTVSFDKYANAIAGQSYSSDEDALVDKLDAELAKRRLIDAYWERVKKNGGIRTGDDAKQATGLIRLNNLGNKEYEYPLALLPDEDRDFHQLQSKIDRLTDELGAARMDEVNERVAEVKRAQAELYAPYTDGSKLTNLDVLKEGLLQAQRKYDTLVDAGVSNDFTVRNGPYGPYNNYKHINTDAPYWLYGSDSPLASELRPGGKFSFKYANAFSDAALRRDLMLRNEAGKGIIDRRKWTPAPKQSALDKAEAPNYSDLVASGKISQEEVNRFIGYKKRINATTDIHNFERQLGYRNGTGWTPESIASLVERSPEIRYDDKQLLSAWIENDDYEQVLNWLKNHHHKPDAKASAQPYAGPKDFIIRR